ncbi:MAG: radical SAM protein [Chloroflexi bacterium HGW-Chloroflexi-6]|nr:MAG: radical SAM protein [Chloroflexi bacterium HGW-Chloroflexi-6]
MTTEILAKTLLSSAKQPDPWFGIKYTMNLYRGCQHQCIYCDSRSECYQIADFAEIQVKVNALDRLSDEIRRKKVKGTIGTGSMNDPYMPVEAERRLTRGALQIISAAKFPVHIITKSDLVTRDVDILQEISRVYAAVSFSITSADDALSKKLEPGAPVSSRRFAALKTLSENGITAGLTMMPILPFIEDSDENIRALLRMAGEAGAKYIIPGFGLTLRDRQREYYYAKLDRLFPGLREQYQRRYGERYSAESPRAARLGQIFKEECARLGIATKMPFYRPESEQLQLF